MLSRLWNLSRFTLQLALLLDKVSNAIQFNKRNNRHYKQSIELDSNARAAVIKIDRHEAQFRWNLDGFAHSGKQQQRVLHSFQSISVFMQVKSTNPNLFSVEPSRGLLAQNSVEKVKITTVNSVNAMMAK